MSQSANQKSMALLHPKLAAQWHPTLNEGLSPEDIAINAFAHAWWRCENGHEFFALLNDRLRDDKCPHCKPKSIKTDSLKVQHPRIAKQWDTQKNGALTAADVSVDSTLTYGGNVTERPSMERDRYRSG